MRAGLSTIQQTLTPEASAVLTASISEATRRNHSQTTPLHVASTLLSSPSGYLRQACIRSHPNSSHPLQCRALELCFSVALERLPAVAASAGVAEPPPVSNALMAALKRAQAHQRRGCPEQQQQPLLAVKVELEQLIISILDDPSVSRVMREASFSSPAVKSAIEQSLGGSLNSNLNPPISIGFRPGPIPVNRNMYLNPRLQQQQQGNLAQSGEIRIEEIKRISDIFSRSKKKNPILVGEIEPETVMKELRIRFEKGEFREGDLKDAKLVPFDGNLERIGELGVMIEGKMGNSNSQGVVLDLGDLKWMVEPLSSGGAQPPEAGRAAVAEVAKEVKRFGDGGNGRLWLIGTATCETYLRCQIYYPSMESDWDLQAVPIAPRSPFPGMFPRLGGNGNSNGSIESLNPLKNLQSSAALTRRVPESLDPIQQSNRCPQCTENYEQELSKLVANEYERSSSEAARLDMPRSRLPQWLQDAKSDNGDAKSLDKSQTKEQEVVFKEKSQELQKKWSDTCLRMHPSFHRNLGSGGTCSVRVVPPMTLYNPKLLLNQPPQNKLLLPNKELLQNKLLPNKELLQNKLLPNKEPLQNKLLQNKALGVTLQLNSCPKTIQPPEQVTSSPPKSPVRTELVLGQNPQKEDAEKDRVQDLLGCISSEFQIAKFSKALDTDSYKRLLKGLMEKVWWQKEAASAVASTVTKCKVGDGKRRGHLSKGDTWLLFTGPDRVGKKKMASVISEQICGSNPIMISLGRRRSDEELELNFRGKTVLDRIVEAVRRNPFSVVMLEDIDEANMLIRGSIKRAMERGRLADSYGREISLGNIIFILTANWLPNNFNKFGNGQLLDENKLASIASGGWQLRLRIGEKRAKRRANWLHDTGNRLMKPRKEFGLGLSFDLNLMADFDEDRTDGSYNSSDLTGDHDDNDQIRRFSITSVPIELANFIDDAIVFKPVEMGPARDEARSKISEKIANIVDNVSIELEEEALDKILGGVYLGRTSLDEWAMKILVPSFDQIKTLLPSTTSCNDNIVVRLEIDGDSDTRSTGDWLPNSIRVN